MHLTQRTSRFSNTAAARKHPGGGGPGQMRHCSRLCHKQVLRATSFVSTDEVKKSHRGGGRSAKAGSKRFSRGCCWLRFFPVSAGAVPAAQAHRQRHFSRSGSVFVVIKLFARRFSPDPQLRSPVQGTAGRCKESRCRCMTVPQLRSRAAHGQREIKSESAV